MVLSLISKLYLKGLGIGLRPIPFVVDIFDVDLLRHEVFVEEFKCSLSNVIEARSSGAQMQAMMLISAVYYYSNTLGMDRASRSSRVRV